MSHFENSLGLQGSGYFRLRYPDSVVGKQIPAEVFTVDHAQIAIESTEKIIAEVDDLIN